MSKTFEEREAHEKYLVYMKGWRHGACHKPMDPTFLHHAKYGSLYDEAYQTGQKARAEVSSKMAKRFGYTPTILRLCDE